MRKTFASFEIDKKLITQQIVMHELKILLKHTQNIRAKGRIAIETQAALYHTIKRGTFEIVIWHITS